jgi:hypothetical protein
MKTTRVIFDVVGVTGVAAMAAAGAPLPFAQAGRQKSDRSTMTASRMVIPFI